MKFIQNLEGIADQFLKRPNFFKMKILDGILAQVIPFNIPHRFSIKTISEDEVTVVIPWRRKNLNHVKGIHACAIATLGEYCAGLLLIRHFSVGKYRPILSKLEALYFYQGKTDLTGQARLEGELKAKVEGELGREGLSNITMETVIKDANGQHVSTVKTYWQLKAWDKVKTPTN